MWTAPNAGIIPRSGGSFKPVVEMNRPPSSSGAKSAVILGGNTAKLNASEKLFLLKFSLFRGQIKICQKKKQHQRPQSQPDL